jgi:hypothetical protein
MYIGTSCSGIFLEYSPGKGRQVPVVLSLYQHLMGLIGDCLENYTDIGPCPSLRYKVQWELEIQSKVLSCTGVLHPDPRSSKLLSGLVPTSKISMFYITIIVLQMTVPCRQLNFHSKYPSHSNSPPRATSNALNGSHPSWRHIRTHRCHPQHYPS